MFENLNETEVAELTPQQLVDWVRECFYDQEQRMDSLLIYETPFSQHCLVFDCRPRQPSLLLTSEHLNSGKALQIATLLIDGEAGYWYDDCDELRYTITLGTNGDPDFSLPVFELADHLPDTLRLTRDFALSGAWAYYLSIQMYDEE